MENPFELRVIDPYTNDGQNKTDVRFCLSMKSGGFESAHRPIKGSRTSLPGAERTIDEHRFVMLTVPSSAVVGDREPSAEE